MIGAAEIRNARILVVDDSAVNVTLLVRILEAAGYTGVTSTTRSTDVRALYAAEKHDLILLDLMMPEMDGFEVLEALHEIETEGYLPVVVLTAQPKHRMRALLAGARDFITKPFDQAEVLARIRNVLESRLLLLESRSNELLLQQYDQLTGLPNRRRYRELLMKAVGRPGTISGRIAVLFIDVDHFQSVNDVLGRTIGGVMLASVADRLLACLSPMSTLARLEGSRFGVILVLDDVESGPATREAADGVAQRLRDALRVPIEVDGHELVAALSIGIAISPTDASDADGLLTCAARALSDATATGGDTVRYHSDATNREAEDALALATALRGALEREEFTLVYQPKMRIATGEWVSAEALLRWDRPGVGPVAPGSFIRVLEETGLIVPVGSWVLSAVCRQIAAWERDGLGWIRVAVNVSSRQFAQKGFVAEVAAALALHGVPAIALDLEITEGSLMSRAPETRTTLLALKALGIKLAIDDFGTGYSSLSYLQRYPIDTLKLDISFVRGITTKADDAAIAIAIIQMARVLRLTVVAEGVETPEQLEFLSVHACDEIQGFLFSRPLPPVELARLRRESPVPGQGAPVVPMSASPSDGVVPDSLG